MNKQFGKDFTTGSIPRHLLKFLLPILLGNLVTTGYSIVNAVWVGRLLGGDAMGAVGASFPLIMIVNALISGMTTAAAILIAKYYGSKQTEKIQKAVNCSWTIALAAIVAITTAGIIWAEPLLRALHTPEALLGMGASYLRITFAGVAFMYISTLIVSILRGIGDTATPMIFMVLSTVINAILDPLLIIGIGPFPAMGLNGAAVASLAAVGVATLSGYLYIRRKYHGMPVNFTALDFDRRVVWEIVKLGLPAFVQQALISVSAAVVVTLVNGFGATATDAYSVASRVDSIAIMPAMAMFMAVSTLTAQNIGAGKPERIKGIFKWGVAVNVAVVALVSALVVFFSSGVMHLFVNDTQIVAKGTQYFAIVGASYVLFALSFVTNGIINGAGKTTVTMVFSILSLCAIRIPLAIILSGTSLGLQGIWLAVALSFASTAVMSMGYYFTGRWKRSRENRKTIIEEKDPDEGRALAEEA